MIRFKTIDPAGKDKPAEKPAVAPATVVTPPEPESAAGDDPGAEGKGKAKGMTRKTPMRAKKPGTSGLFRD
ncbi:MAG: hypothetical protein DCF30_10875 [Hyphomicrobiales bacterium]|nr:MAG: hypothetical protein DCF30_10875 [Hyphomicrobiales bacterium]